MAAELPRQKLVTGETKIMEILKKDNLNLEETLRPLWKFVCYFNLM